MRRRRAVTLLFAIGALAVMMVAVLGLMTQTGIRYEQARGFEDRIQALHLAQAGLLWARAERAAGRAVTTHRLALAPAGEAVITATGGGERIEAEGRVLRDGEVMATQRLTVRWAEEARP